jgi:acyl-CoA thioesterase-2
MPTIEAFLEALTLLPDGNDRYRATNVDFGRQLIAQTMMAAEQGQEGKTIKSVHTVFARAALPDLAVELTVDRMHSGRAFASSTITVNQGDRLCARSLVLLSAPEDDVIRHADAARRTTEPADVAEYLRREGAWELGIVDGVDLNDPDQVGPPELDVWVRFAGAPDVPSINRALVAFTTDGYLIATAMRPHAGVGQSQAHRTLSTGVLSHTISFHEPCSAGAWHLLEHRSTYAGHGRCFGRGEVFGPDGQLAASFVQDAMIRARSGGPGAL